MSNFATKIIQSTYQSLLNISAGGNETLSTSLSVITDGAGNNSSLSIATANNGAKVTGALTITGQLSSGTLLYPKVGGTSTQFLATDGAGTATFRTISASDISPIVPSPSGTYTGSISSITINGVGMVSSVGMSPTTPGLVTWLTTPINLSTSTGNNTLNTLPSWTTSVLVEFTMTQSDAGNPYKSIYLKKTSGSAIQYVLCYDSTNDTARPPRASGQGFFPVNVGNPPTIYATIVGTPSLFRVIGYM